MSAKLRRLYDLALFGPAALALAIPYRHRWKSLVTIAGALLPVTRAVRRYRGDYTIVGLVSEKENVLHNLLARATQLGIAFEPALSHAGLDAVDTALSSGKPVMVVGIHAELLYLAGRYLIERGCDLMAARARLRLPLIGKPGASYPGLAFDDPRAMLRLSRMMTPGRVISALIDGAPPGRRAIDVRVGTIDIAIAYPLLKLAIDRGAAILFFHPRLIGDRVEIRWGNALNHADLDDVIAAFGQFLNDQIA